MAIKYGGVRVLAFRIWNLEFRYRPGSWVKFSDVALEISREPNISVAIGHQSVRAGIFQLQRKLLERSRPGIEPAQLVGHLFREPQRAVRADRRIMRVRAFCGNVPFADGDFQFADFRCRRCPARSKRDSQSQSEA